MGKVLRKLHLDELPQLFNVIKGEMSLVGPRPERPEFVSVLAAAIPDYRKRLAVRPGVTGLAQINLPPDSDLVERETQTCAGLRVYRVRRVAAGCSPPAPHFPADLQNTRTLAALRAGPASRSENSEPCRMPSGNGEQAAEGPDSTPATILLQIGQSRRIVRRPLPRMAMATATACSAENTPIFA